MRKRYIAIIMLLCTAFLVGCQEVTNGGLPRNEEETPLSIEDTSIPGLNHGQVSQDVQRGGGNITQELEELMTTFGQAYFNGDIDTIEKLLINDYEWDIEVYESPDQMGEIEIMQIKGLQQIDEQQLLDKYELSIEFQILNEDSLTYLSVTWKNIEGTWKKSGYGLEK